MRPRMSATNGLLYIAMKLGYCAFALTLFLHDDLLIYD